MQALLDLLHNPAILAALAGGAAREIAALPGQLIALATKLAGKTQTTADDELVKAVAEALKK